MSSAVSAFLYEKDYTPRSRDWYAAQLRLFVDWCQQHECPNHQPVQDIAEVSTKHVKEFIAAMRATTSRFGRPLSGNTLHGYARAANAFLRWCVDEGLIAEGSVQRWKLPRREAKVIPVFTPAQVEELFEACERANGDKNRWLAERDRAILAVFLDTGIRRAELIDLTLDRTFLDKDDPHIIVNGKGRKQRELGLGLSACKQLYRYIHRFRPKDATSPYVFITRDRRQMNDKGVDAILFRLKTLTGISNMRCTAHDFRHTFAYNYMRAGGDVLKLSLLLGHTSLSVTEGYLRSFKSREARKGLSVLDTLRG